MKSLIGRCSLGIVAIVLALLLSEIALRLSGLFPYKELRSVSKEKFNQIPGIWEPGQSLVSISIPELPHRISTNFLGLRGEDPPQNWTTKKKVLFIGDSFTFGSYVDDQETLPSVVGERLGENWVVFNGGVGGSTIVDQLQFLEGLLVLRPDIVVLIASENDLDDLYSDPPMHEQLRINRELKAGNLGMIYSFFRDTCLFNLALKTKAKLKIWRSANTKKFEKQESGSSQAETRQLMRYVIALNHIQEKVKEIGARFIFASYPSHLFLYERQTESALHKINKAVSVPVKLNFAQVLSATKRPTTDLYLLPHDGHPTALGYQITAQLMAKEIRRIG